VIAAAATARRDGRAASLMIDDAAGKERAAEAEEMDKRCMFRKRR
jgi:hypothetical protein